MRKLLALVTVVASLTPFAAAAKAPADLWLIMEDGRPSRRFIRTTARNPVSTVTNKPTISYVPLEGMFHSADYGVRVSYPRGWELQSQAQSTPPLTLVAAFLSPRTTTVRQNVNLVIEDLASPMTLEEYTRQGIDIEKNMLSGFSLISNDNISFFGKERASRIRFSATSGTDSLLFEQIWFIRGKRAYVWTFADKQSTFPQNISTFERMMDSFLID